MKTAKCNRKVVKFGPHLFIHLLFFHSNRLIPIMYIPTCTRYCARSRK